MSVYVTEMFDAYSDGTRNVCRVYLEADTAADLPGPTDLDGLRLLMGSKGHVIDTDKTYWMNSSGVWYEASGSMFENVYTKTEIDDMISEIDSLDEIQSAALADLIDDGPKNRMPVPTRIGPSNASAAATYTQAGVSFTCNQDGSITVERISANTNQAVLWLYDDNSAILVNDYTDGEYVFYNGFVGSSETARMRLSNLFEGSYLVIDEWAVIPESSTADNKNISIIVYPTFTGTITVKPMICRKTYWDITRKYVPHAPTNYELLQMIQNL